MVETDLIPKIWPEVRELIGDALKHAQGDGVSPDVLLPDLLNEDLGMLLVTDHDRIRMVMVFGIERTTITKFCIHILAGDDMQEWFDWAWPKVQGVAELVGAECIEASCRPGMAKLLKKRGWKQQAVIMRIQ
ncbi:MAG: hypothetical protein AAF529_20185 [Pseudomonadota bacterium]